MPPTALPRVSICLLTYKRAHALPATLDSLLAQTHKDFELIINDDRSPDDTEKICRDYERRDSRVRYFKNAANLRYAGNQNAALARATCDYVAIVHDGDIYSPRLIESWTSALVNNPTAALVFNAINALNDKGEIAGTYTHNYAPLIDGRELCRDMLSRLHSPIYGIVMVRKACVESVGPFDLSLPYLADVDMWLRLLMKYDAAYVSEPLFNAAPREKDHANLGANWRIHDELERIHAVNYRRALEIPTIKTQGLARTILQIFWKQRIFLLVWCVRHAEFAKLWEGLKFVLSKSVLDEKVPA